MEVHKPWQALLHEEAFMTENTHLIPRIQGVSVKEGTAIVYGIPVEYFFLPEDHPDQHNCDEMGCGLAHVLWRGPIDEAVQGSPSPCQHERTKPGCTLRTVDPVTNESNTWRYICQRCQEQFALPVGVAALPR